MDDDCPEFEDGHVLEEESLYSYTIINENMTVPSHLQSFCFNYPLAWDTCNTLYFFK